MKKSKKSLSKKKLTNDEKRLEIAVEKLAKIIRKLDKMGKLNQSLDEQLADL